jgi:hypothetical protein
MRRFAVYYRDIPTILHDFVKADGNITLTKDGVYKGLGHSCPRLTLVMEDTNPNADKQRMKKLEALLSELESNNQIAGWN